VVSIWLGSLPARCASTATGDGGLVGELTQSGGQAEVGQDLRLDAVDELAQLGHQLLGLLVRGG
jgi:hypothetical protein